MSTARANGDIAPRGHRADPAPWRSTSRAAMDGAYVPGIVPLNREIRQQLVLEALVEAFGGEATVAALSRHLSHQLGRTLGALEPQLIDVLQVLHRLGTLSLEADGKNGFIVRLLPESAKLRL